MDLGRRSQDDDRVRDIYLEEEGEGKGGSSGAGVEVSVCSLPLWGSWDTLRHRLGIALVGLTRSRD